MNKIAPERDARGNYTIGTNPGQISSTGSYYSASGVGNDPGKAEYSSFSAMTNYTTTAGKFGYYGTLGMAIEQAKQGNKKAQAVVNAVRDKNAFQAMEDDKRSDSEVSQGLGDAQTSAVTAADQAVSEATGGKTTSSTGFTDMSAFSHNAPGDNSSSSSDNGAETMGGEDVAKGSLITKRKASGKLKKKYMKQGGLASRK